MILTRVSKLVVPSWIIIDRKDEVFPSLLKVCFEKQVQTNPKLYILTLSHCAGCRFTLSCTVITSFKVARISLYLHRAFRQVGHLFELLTASCWLYVDCYFMAHYGDNVCSHFVTFRYEHLVTVTSLSESTLTHYAFLHRNLRRRMCVRALSLR